MKNIFVECKDLISVKNLYIKLVKENHPDLGGNLELMQAINAEYDLIKEKGLEGYYHQASLSSNGLDSKHINLDFDSEAFIAIVKFCMNTGLIVELCGSWLWISGDTKEQKDHLKELGCKWSANKAMWYYTDAPYRKKGNRIKAIKEAKEQYLLHDLIVFETYLGTMSLSMKGKTSNGTKQVYIEEPSGKFIYTTVDYFLIRYSSLNEQVLNWIRERK